VSIGARAWTVAYVGVVAAFVAAVATYYHPEFGFTALIEFPLARHELEIPEVRNVPHYDHPDSGGYDGQFYAQLAVKPLLGDRTLDAALDTPPYRARRILVPWISYVAGLGRPAAILQAYALHAVVAWLLLAWLVTRWIPPTTGRGFVLASTAMLAHGPLMSVRYALPDLAAALLIAFGVLAVERRRPWRAAALVGAAGLARDTALSGVSLFAHGLRASPASWLRAAGCVLAAAVPLAVWFDYVRAIYRSTSFAGSDHFGAPLSGFWWKASGVWSGLARGGLSAPAIDDVAALVAFSTQAAWLVWLLARHRDASPWVLAGLGFLALAAVADPPVWEGSPGAYPRVFMPVMLAAHTTLARRPGLWWLVALSGLDVVPGIRLLA